MNEGWVEQTLAANHTASYFLSILGASSFTSSFIYAINLCPLPGQLHFTTLDIFSSTQSQDFLRTLETLEMSMISFPG